MTDLRRLTVQAAARSAGLRLYARQWITETEAEDVVQQALVSLFSLKTAPRDPIAWMYRVVRNASLDLLKARQRRSVHERANAQAAWFMPASESALDAATAQQALSGLPADLREVVLLRIWGDLGFASIAEVVDCSVSTAHARYASGLDELRKRLEQSCSNPKT